LPATTSPTTSQILNKSAALQPPSRNGTSVTTNNTASAATTAHPSSMMDLKGHLQQCGIGHVADAAAYLLASRLLACGSWLCLQHLSTFEAEERLGLLLLPFQTLVATFDFNAIHAAMLLFEPQRFQGWWLVGRLID
jgi:hypothetical protein